MSSAQSKLWKARRNIAQRKKTTQATVGALGTLSSVASFAGDKLKASKTAWESYEKGYEALGGKDFKGRAKFGEKGWFKDTFSGPSGDIIIGEGTAKAKKYDIKDITKAGKFLSTDAAAVLDEKTRSRYLEATVKGEDAVNRENVIKGNLQKTWANQKLSNLTSDSTIGFSGATQKKDFEFVGDMTTNLKKDMDTLMLQQKGKIALAGPKISDRDIKVSKLDDTGAKHLSTLQKAQSGQTAIPVPTEVSHKGLTKHESARLNLQASSGLIADESGQFQMTHPTTGEAIGTRKFLGKGGEIIEGRGFYQKGLFGGKNVIPPEIGRPEVPVAHEYETFDDIDFDEDIIDDPGFEDFEDFGPIPAYDPYFGNPNVPESLSASPVDDLSMWPITEDKSIDPSSSIRQLQSQANPLNIGLGRRKSKWQKSLFSK